MCLTRLDSFSVRGYSSVDLLLVWIGKRAVIFCGLELVIAVIMIRIPFSFHVYACTH